MRSSCIVNILINFKKFETVVIFVRWSCGQCGSHNRIFYDRFGKCQISRHLLTRHQTISQYIDYSKAVVIVMLHDHNLLFDIFLHHCYFSLKSLNIGYITCKPHTSLNNRYIRKAIEEGTNLYTSHHSTWLDGSHHFFSIHLDIRLRLKDLNAP